MGNILILAGLGLCFANGIDWNGARGNLRETLEIMYTICGVDDIENGVMDRVFQ